MKDYSLKKQRVIYLTTLKNDAILNAAQKDENLKWDQVAAGKKAFKGLWFNLYFRICFNIALPFIMIVGDFAIPFYYLFISLKKSKKTIAPKRLFVGHEERLYKLSNVAGLQKEDDIWLKLFNNSKFTLPADKNQIDALQLVGLKEILKSSINSVVIHIMAITSLGYKYYFLSYKSFTWCLMDFALRNVNPDVELVYSYICDRNAILIDALPNKNKTMIQHGSMHFGSNPFNTKYKSFDKDKGFYIWNSLYKSSPSTVYCYTDIDEWALKKSVIANQPVFKYMGYGFKPNYYPSKKSILIVGNFYLFKEEEESIIRELQDLDVEIFLKNHPSHSDKLYDEMRSKYKFNYIQGSERKFPDVNILISYDSTLAYEYASIGTKVLYYGQFDIKNIRQIVVGFLL